MAMPADLSPSNSPKSKLNRKPFPSPWTQVVRGGEEPDTTSPRSPSASDRANFADCSSPPGEPTATEGQVEISDDNAAVSKKSAWKAVNGEVGSGPVMGAAWPTISESTRPSPKSSSNSSKHGSISISQGPVISNAPQKKTNATNHPNFTPSHKQPHRQRSMKRGGGAGGGSGQSGFARPPPPPPPFPIPFGNILPLVMDLPIREPPYKGNNWETRPIGVIGSHSHMGNDHSSHRHSSRRGNFGSRPRGDGVHPNGHGGKRDQDRGWNAPRNSTARDIHMHQLAPPPPPPPPRGFTRPALTGSTPFIPPQHVRPFGNHMAFDMVPPFLYAPPLPPESFRGVPLVSLPPPPPPPPPMFFPVMDPNMRTLLLNQIDYYFSDANLVKDNFLRSNMDDQGWVPISLIASFPRVLNLTSNVQLILGTLGASTVVEVQGDKVRRRDDWRKWIPASAQFSADSDLQSPNKQPDNMLATSIEKLQLDATTNQVSAIDMEESHPEVVPGKFSFEEIAWSKSANGEDTAEAA